MFINPCSSSLASKTHNLTLFQFTRTFSSHSWLSISGNPLLKWPQSPKPISPSPETNHPHSHQEEHHLLLQTNITTITRVLTQHLSENTSQEHLEAALDRTQIKPTALLFTKLFEICEFSSNPLFKLFIWAEKKLGYHHDPLIFNSMINLLAKMREFDTSWLLIDRYSRESPSLVSIETFTIMIRRYARADMPEAAIRTFEFMENSGFSSPGSNSLDLVLDALCKEGLIRVASKYFERRKPDFVPCITSYNILLNGWLKWGKLGIAEKLWEEMRTNNVGPTVVSYGTLIDGYCRMRRVERAIELLEEMKRNGIRPNMITCNPIIDALGEARMFDQAFEMLKGISNYGLSPTISTYNCLVKGFCKAGNLVGASKILKMMIGSGCLPTATTYNYFFRFFSKYGRIEEGMNLYTKMIECGYEPDRLTYQLIIKMLCERERLDLTVQIIREMNARGFDSDLATSTMLIHLLCRLHRFEEACGEFEEMISRGVVPQYLTYRKLTTVLKRMGMAEMLQKISSLMTLTRHSMNLPDTYEQEKARNLRSSIMKKARVMSDALKTSRDPKELRKLMDPSVNAVESAEKLIATIKGRFYAT